MRARLFAIVVGMVVLGMVPPGAVRASEVVATVPVSGVILSVAHDDARKELWVATGELSVTVVDTATNAVAAVVPLPHYAEAVGVNPVTGRVYVAGGSPGRLTVIDTATRTVVASRAAPELAHRVAVDRTRNRVYVTGELGTVAVVDGTTHAVSMVNVGGTPFGIDVDEGRNRVYVVDPDGPRLLALDGTTAAVTASMPLPSPLLMVAAVPSANRLYLSGSSEMVVVDGATLTVVGTLDTGVGDVTAADAANRVYATDVTTNRLHIIDGGSNTVLASVTVGARPVPLDADPATQLVYVGNQDDSTVSVVRDTEVVGPPPPPPPPPNQAPDCSGVAVSPTTLWPANHAFGTVGVAGATDPDGDAVALAVTGVTQDEPVGEAPDAAAMSGAAVQLRAEREGGGDGRVYRVGFTATDAHGATCSGTAAVTVPQRPKATAVDSGASFDSFAG